MCEAAYEGDIQLIKMFVTAEADLNQTNFDYRNLGHIAAAEGKQDIIELLSSTNKYDFNKKDRWGKSALDLVKWSEKYS